MSADPVPMLLWCPDCGKRHIDAGDFATRAHHTHACQHCGHVWRPAIVATVGVRFLPGFKDDGEPLDEPPGDVDAPCAGEAEPPRERPSSSRRAREERLPLDAATLRALTMQKPEKERLFSDPDCQGLYLRMAPNRLPTWVHIFRRGKKSRHHTIGHYRDVTLNEARAIVAARRHTIQHGVIPASPSSLRLRPEIRLFP